MCPIMIVLIKYVESLRQKLKDIWALYLPYMSAEDLRVPYISPVWAPCVPYKYIYKESLDRGPREDYPARG